MISESYRCLAFLLLFLLDFVAEADDECFFVGGGSWKLASLDESFSCLMELESVSSSPLLVPPIESAEASVSPDTAATEVMDDLENSLSFSRNFLFLLLFIMSTLDVDLLALR